MTQGKIWFPNDVLKEFVGKIMNELMTLTAEGYKSQHDDHGDCIAQLGQMKHLIVTPSIYGGEFKLNDNNMEYMDYDEENTNSYIIN